MRKHFSGRPDVDVIVERRACERRTRAERRMQENGADCDRRHVRSARGRRIADRRALGVPVESPGLPRAASRYADRVVFVELLRTSGIRAEDLDTNRLVARFQAGSRDAFVELYMRYFDRLFGYLRLTLRHDQTAEDVAQDVFTRVLVHLPDFDIDARRPFRHWLFRIARNAAIDELRRAGQAEVCDPDTMMRRHEAHASRGSSEIDSMSLGWITDPELTLFIERLPPDQSQVLALTYMLGLSTRDIATVLGSTVDAVFQQRSRALRTLEARLSAIGRGHERPAQAVHSVALFRQAPILRARRFALQG